MGSRGRVETYLNNRVPQAECLYPVVIPVTGIWQTVMGL